MAHTIDMGAHQPSEYVSRRITGDTQFMFQFYKPCIQYYATGGNTAMSEPRLRQSLIQALHGCPLLFGRFKIHPSLSVSLDYDPENSNPPTLEFQKVALGFTQLRAENFAYAMATRHGLDMKIPDGSIGRGKDLPMLMVKVSYLVDGGVVLFSMTNHVAFDGNAMFSFLAHWARCNRQMDSPQVPGSLQTYATSLVTPSDRKVTKGPVEISVDASRTPAEILQANSKVVGEGLQACVFSISVDNVKKLVDMVGTDMWVSSNNAVAGFIMQCVARANTESMVYEPGDWTLFQALDMRRPLGLTPHGLGSPLILAECHAINSEISDPQKFPEIARRVRTSLAKYTGEYLQSAMDWMRVAYSDLAQSGVLEPWRHFWFSALNTNRRAVGVSCMNRIPVYDADFGSGWPAMARSFNPRPNYVIVFPGPPVGPGFGDYACLHLYVTLERPAMEALQADVQWNEMCRLVSDK
ncbi:hypothetical protein GGI20_003933 [Coemansia sp. BCRC 34301]|nr:hypothetical protein GGI20_003933 [Coemansia sp. BCRC 34301]